MLNKRRANRPEHPCPQCNSTHVRSYGKSWQCADCGKYWVKHPKKVDGWQVWNKGLTIKTSESVANGTRKMTATKRKNRAKYRNIFLENHWKPKIRITVEDFKKLYYEEKLSQGDIAKKLGVNQSAISLWMKS